MIRKLIFRSLLAASILLTTIQIGQTSDHIGMNKVYAETPVISFGIGNPGIQSPIVQQAWSVKVDNWDDYLTTNSTVAGEGKVFTLRDRKLIALNAQTGKILWTFEDDVQPTFVYHGGNIFGVLNNGRLYALSASNGKKLWTSSVQIEKPNAIEVFGDTVYYLLSNYIVAVHLKTGKQLWVNSEPLAEYGYSGLQDAGEVVLRVFTINGESNTYNQLNAIDKKTGKKLWGIIDQNVPIKIEGGLAYSIKYNSQPIDESPERSITISVINVKTGEIKGSRVYRWSITEGSGDKYDTHISTYFDGNNFYIHHNGIIEIYDFKNYKPESKPLKTYSESTYDRDFYPLNKVHRGRILFGKSQNGLLTSMKTVNGQDLSWTGDNPSALTVVYGKGVYLAQTDGIMHALDFDTSKPLFRVKTGARKYEQILKEDGFLIIQTPDRLVGVKLPAALK